MVRALLVVLVAMSLTLSTAAAPAPAPGDGPRIEDLRIDVLDGPARDRPQSLDARWYVPDTADPAPAMLLAHGFGGSKESLDAEARDLVARGYAVLAYTARGFGESTGDIRLNDPDHEVADAEQLVDWIAAQPGIRLDAPGDPRIGVMGGSYGGALALLLAGVDPRVDAIVPMITWNDLEQSLFPDSAAAVDAGTPAAAVAGGEGVFKRAWGGVFFGTGSAGPSGLIT